MKGDVDFLETSYNMDGIQNILFIDTTSVSEYKELVNFANKHTLAIPYNPTTTTRQYMETILQREKCRRIGFVFTTYREDVNSFLENRPYDEDENVKWMTEMICKYKIPAIDFFGCKTLLYDSWKKYYRKLVLKTDVAVYANPNVTGNSVYGGEWRLNLFCDLGVKLNNEFVVNLNTIYFNKKIETYKHLFDGIINRCCVIDINNTVWTTGNNSNSTLGQGAGKGSAVLFFDKIVANGSLPVDYSNNIQTIGSSVNTLFVSLKNSGQNRIYCVGYNSASNGIPGMVFIGSSSSFLACASFNTVIETTTNPTAVKILGAELNSSRVLLENGNLYQAGFVNSSSFGTYASISGLSLRFTRSTVTGISDIQVQYLDPSFHTTLLLRSNGEVKGYGSKAGLGTADGLGIGTALNTNVSISANSETTFSKISMSNTHTMLLSTTNKIYCTGYNTNGQFGNTSASTSSLNNTWYQMTLPRLPATGPPTISNIVAGNNVSYVLYSDGSLYGCGNNTNNQINRSATQSFSTLQYVLPPLRKTIKQVSCMVNSTQILTTDNIPFSVGNDATNGIGIGSSTSATDFTQMSVNSTRTVLMKDVLNINGITPITVSAKTPTINSVVASTAGTINTTPKPLTVSYTAISATSDPSLNYYYYLNDSTTPILITANPFDITAANGLISGSNEISLVGIIYSGTTVLWQSSVSAISTGTPYIIGSAPSGLLINPVEGALGSLTVSFNQSLNGNPSGFIYYYLYVDANATPFKSGYYSDMSSVTVPLLSNSTHTIKIQTKSYTNNANAIAGTNVIWTTDDISGQQTPYYAETAPQNLVLTATANTTNSITVSFNTPATAGNPGRTFYQYALNSGSFNNVSNLNTFGSTNTFTISTGITTGQLYTVRLKSISSSIWTSPEVSGTVTANKFGSQPTLILTCPSSNQLTFTYAQATQGTSTTTFFYSLSGGTLTVAPASPFIVSSLISTSPYTAYILARNPAGDISSNIATGNVFGTTPIISSVTPGLNKLTVNFSQTTKGTDTTTYYYNSNGTTTTRDGTATNPTFDISGLLTATQKTIYIVASNPAGNVVSSGVAGTPYITGNAPSGLSISPVTGTLGSLKATYSLSTGGNPSLYTYYYYSLDGSSTLNSIGKDASSVIIPGLSNDLHTVTIKAKSYLSDALASNTANAIWTTADISGQQTPYYAGTPPSGLSLTKSNTLNSLNIALSGASAGGNPSAFTYYYLYLNSTATPFKTGKYTDVSFVTITGLSNDSHTITVRTKAYTSDASASNTANAIWTTADISGQATPYYAGSVPSAISVTPLYPQYGTLRYSFTGSSGGNPTTVQYYASTNSSTTLGSLGTGVTGTTLNVTDLSNQAYQYYIIAVGLSGGAEIWRSSTLAPQSATPYIQGAQPSVSTVVTPGLNSLTFTYSAVGGNPSPTYYYSTDSAGTQLLGATSITSITISDLNVNQPYQYYIIAVGLSGSTEIWRTTSTQTIATTPYITGSAPGVTIAPLDGSENAIQVTYTNSSGGNPVATKYQYYTTTSGANGTLTDVPGSNPFTISGLMKNASYTVTMRALGIVSGTTIWTSINQTSTSVTTNQIGTAPSITASATPGTTTSINISITTGSLNGTPALTKYQYSTDNGGSFKDLTEILSAYTITIDSSTNATLITGAPYQVLLRAVSGTAWNINSNIVSVTTNKIGTAPTITNVSAVNLTTNSLKVTFTGSSDGIPATTKYQYYTTPPGVSGIADATSISDGSFIIIGLSAGTAYGVTMRALSGTAWTSLDSTKYTDVSTNKFGSKPTLILTCPSSNQLTFTYAQATQGTSTTTYYYALNNGSLIEAPASPFILSSLTSTSPYTAYILARNPAGDISSNVATGNVFGTTPIISSIDASTNKLRVNFSQTAKGTDTTTYYYSYNADGSNRTGPVNTPSFDISGLTQATPLTIYVVASNPAADNLVSPGFTQTPYVVGSKPEIYSITQGTGKMTVYFNGSVGSNPSPTYYYTDTSNGSNLIRQVTSPFDITGLTSSMIVYIAAVNTAGMVVSDGALGTPNTSGNSPVLNSVVPGLNKITVTFTKDNTGWNPLPDYYYSYNGVNTVAAVTTTTFDITDISTAKTVYIIATNIAGTQVSNNITATPYYAGSNPSGLSISPVTGTLGSLNATYSLSTGGNPSLYTYYYYSLDGSSTLNSIGKDASSVIIPGLSNDSHTVTIKAKSYLSDASASNTANAIWTTADISGQATPYYSGTPPSGLSLTKSDTLNSLNIALSGASAGGNPSAFTYYYLFLDSIATPFKTGKYTDVSFTIIAGLSNDSHTVTIKAKAYTSDASASNTANAIWTTADISAQQTPYYSGIAPAISTITPGLNSLTFAYSGVGGVPSPTYYYSSDGANLLGGGTTDTSITVSNLTVNQTYKYYIIAVGLSGATEIWRTTSLQTTPTKPYIKGSAPSSVTASPVDGSENAIQVIYTDSTGGNPTVTKYQYYTTPFGGSNGAITDVVGAINSTFTISSLTSNTSYTVTMRALGSTAWTSSDQTSQPVTTYKKGGSPSITSVSPINGTTDSISVVFTGSTGGNPSTVTKYQYSTDNGSSFLDASGTASPIIIAGLTAGTQYTIVLKAVAASLTGGTAWVSDNSVASSSVTIYKTGTAPKITSISLVSGTTDSVNVYFNDSTGGYPGLTKYQYSINGGSTFQDASGTASPIVLTIAGLTTGNSYSIVLRAVSGTAWTSPNSNITSTTTQNGTVPQITGVSAVNGTTDSIRVVFVDSSGGNPALTKYQYSINGGSSFQDASGTASPIIIAGLTAGTPYTIVLRAVSTSGAGWTTGNSNTSQSVTTNKIGTTPIITNVYAVDGITDSISVVFTGSTGGTPELTKYQYSTNSGSSFLDASVTSSPITITGLTSATPYQVIIRAVSVSSLTSGTVWVSQNSNEWTSVTTNKLGTAPFITGVSAVNGTTDSISIAFTGSTGGSPTLTKYEYSTNGGSSFLNASGTASPIIIAGLTTGTSYRVILRASSGTAWTSPISNQSELVTTNKIGSSPTITSVVAVNGTNDSISVVFTDSSGGYPTLTKYQYSTNEGLLFLDASGTTSPIIIAGLITGTSYRVILRASSGTAWISQNSILSDLVTTNQIGSKPIITSVTSINGTTDSISVVFTGSTGGNPSTVTKYQYSTDNGSSFLDATGTASPIIIAGLTAGTQYTVVLRAVSGSSWTSPNSTEILSVTTYKTGTAPKITSISPVSGTTDSVNVYFNDSTGGYPGLTKYQYSTDNGSSFLDASGTASPIVLTIAGLTTGNTYSIVLRAVSGTAWTSPNSNITSTTTQIGTVPQITGVSAVDGTTDSIRVVFADSSGGNPALTKYQYSTNGESSFQDASGTASPIIIAGLTAGTPYTIVLRAVSTAGAGWTTGNSNTSSSVTTNQIGLAPVITGVSAVNGSTTSISVVFTGSTGGIPELTKYQYSTNSGSSFLDASVTSSPITITGLTPGTPYTVILRAISSTSWVSPYSNEWSPVTTNKIGGQPIITSVSAVDGTNDSISVLFTGSTGGYPTLTKYQYSTNGGSFLEAVRNSSPIIIAGLNAGTAYTVIIKAISGSNWTSPPSIASQQVTTNKTGTAPIISSVVAVDKTTNSLRVTFTDPSDGIPATTNYQYYTTPPGVNEITDLIGLTGSSFTITGLSAGVAYGVTMRSLSTTAWSSSYSTKFTDVSTNKFGSPPDVSVVNGDGKITVTYSQATAGTAPTTYYYSLNGGALVSAPVSGFDLSGVSLTNTSPYSIFVLARNPAGDISSNTTVTGNVFGSVPTGTAIPGLNKLTVSFSQSIFGTSPTTYYYSDASNGLNRVGPVTSPFDISNISVSKTVYIVASNPAGNTVSSGITGIPYYAGLAPTITSVTPGPGLNSLTVAYGASAGGNPSANTIYYYSVDGSSTLVQIGKYSDASSVTIPGLSNASHMVTITAKGFDGSSNLIWTSPASLSSSATTPYNTGTAPTISAGIPGLNSLRFTVGASIGGNPAANINYDFYLDGSSTPFRTGIYVDVSSIVVSSLSTGTHTVVVRARGLDGGSNLIWTSSDAVGQGVPYTLGSAPVIGAVTPGANQLSVAFTQSAIGSLPTTYFYSIDGATKLGAGTTTSPLLITGISTTTTFYIIANNSAGDIRSVLSDSGTPYLIGSAPTISAVTPGKNSLIVDFSGSIGSVPAPTTYLYSLDGGTYIDGGTATSPLTIRKLTVAKEYAVRIVAQNAGGITEASISVVGTPIIDAGGVVTPATYWTQQYWAKASYWKRQSFWSRKR